MSELLDELAARIAAVSPAWAEVVEPVADAPLFIALDVAAASNLSREVALGIESIREGWLLHRAASRIAPAADPDMALLVGDWCYAAGLSGVAEHGTLADVAVLAELLSQVSAAGGEPVEELELRWESARRSLLASRDLT